jgi:hypothetical protein
LALRIGPDGLGREASMEPGGLGEASAELGHARVRLVERLSCVSTLGCALRPARNNQLRTGTDSGNPTV